MLPHIPWVLQSNPPLFYAALNLVFSSFHATAASTVFSKKQSHQLEPTKPAPRLLKTGNIFLFAASLLTCQTSVDSNPACR